MRITSTGFAGRAVREKALVYDLRVKLKGEERYFIIRVLPARHAAFRKALEKDVEFRLEDYGDILYRGWGEPEDELKSQLREQYGMYSETE